MTTWRRSIRSSGWCPSEEAQLRAIATLEVRRDRALAGLRERFEGALRAEGLNPAAFEVGLDHLESALAVERPLRLSDLSGTPLARVVGRYLIADEEGVSTAVFCYPPAGKWRRSAPPALADALAGEANVILTGPNVVSAELRRIVWGDAARAAILGLVLVFLLLWADLGSPVRSLLALVPLGGRV